ncbi:hypothetical protein Q7P36_008842 [Cladosporium allicinum]
MYAVLVVLESWKFSTGLARCPKSSIQITSKLFLHTLAGAIGHEGDFRCVWRWFSFEANAISITGRSVVHPLKQKDNGVERVLDFAERASVDEPRLAAVTVNLTSLVATPDRSLLVGRMKSARVLPVSWKPFSP